LGPGDSQYVWSFGVEGFADDDSQVELPAIGTPEHEPKQIRAASNGRASRLGSGEWSVGRSEVSNHVPAPTVSNVPAAKPPSILGGNGRVVGIWSRYQLVVTLAFGALAFAILGFLLLKSSIGGHAVTPETSTLVVGLLGTAAFVLLSLTGFALNFLLIEIARDLRRLHHDLN